MGHASDAVSAARPLNTAQVERPLQTATLGRLFFTVAVVGCGVQQILLGTFVRLVPKLPAWMPGTAWLARLAGAVLVGIGLALLAGRRARAAAVALAALLLACFAFLHVRDLATSPGAAFMWTNPLKDLAILGGVLILFPILPADGARGITAER